jgi:hypothetical protein
MSAADRGISPLVAFDVALQCALASQAKQAAGFAKVG